MRKITPFLLFGYILLMLVSCQKEESLDTLGKSSVGFAEVGTWKLLSITSSASQATEFNDGVNDQKIVTVRNFVSGDNGGTITFSGSIMTANGLTFSIDTIAKTYLYTNGTLEDSLDVPVGASLPPTDLTDGYTKVTADSLYFQSGLLSTVISVGSQTGAAGVKLTFDGDKMILTSEYNKRKFGLGQGAQTITTHEVNIITLQKQ